MTTPPLSAVTAQKAQMAKILFWLFVTVFSITALFAFVALSIVFIIPERAENFPQFNRLVWALWGVVLAEVAAGIFALWQKLFNLSAEGQVATATNIVAEIIDGLESNGDISEEKANALRSEYSKVLGTAARSNVRVTALHTDATQEARR